MSQFPLRSQLDMYTARQWSPPLPYGAGGVSAFGGVYCLHSSPPPLYGAGGVSSFRGPIDVARPPLRVAVFIDWMNVYKAARRAFGLLGAHHVRGQINPHQTGRLLAAACGRSEAVRLARVEVHRGQPLPNQDPVGHAAVFLHARAWRAAAPDIVVPQLRPLRYRSGAPPEEKGVDVHLAACAFEWAVIEAVDTVVIFSHDTDLKPIVEVLARVKDPAAVATASWFSPTHRQRIPPVEGVVNHQLDKPRFLEIEDRTNYGRKARARIEARKKKR
jgi:NYN domain-containing protein